MTTPSIAPPCAAERTLRARTGAVLFRWRSWLPVPIVAALFLTRTEVVLSTVLLGAAIALAGSAMRAAGVAAAVVKVIGCVAVPTARKPPCTNKPVLPLNRTSTPGSTVNKTPLLTVRSPTTMRGNA
jgi:hypothetical protein